MLDTPARLQKRPRVRLRVRARAPLLGLGFLVVLLAVPGAIASRPTVLGAGPVNLSQSPGRSANPTIAAAGDSTMVVWEEGDALWFARKSNAGWSAAAPVPSAVGSLPAVVATGERYELVWSGFDEIGGNFEVYHSQFEGGSWSLPEIISASAEDSIQPDIAVAADGTRLVVWVEVDAADRFLYAASALAGGPWTYGPVPGGEGTSPDAAAGGGVWHLAWSNDVDGDGADDVLYIQRGAAGWGLLEVVAGSGSVTATNSSLEVDSSNRPAVAWLVNHDEVWFSREDGAGWSEPVRLDAGEGTTDAPALAWDDAGAHVAWARGTEVLVTHVADEVWSAPKPALGFAVAAHGADLVADRGRLALVAEGRPQGGEGDIYYARLELPGEPTAIPSMTPPFGVKVYLPRLDK